MSMEFKRADKSQSLLRLAMFGIAGSGKTMSSLRMAVGLAGDKGKIAAIDTERGSISKYADRFQFDVLELTDPKIENYIEAMRLAASAGYNVLIIDSLSHGWQELLEEIDVLTKTKYKGNSMRAWSEGTPKQKRFINAILTYPGHVIATMRGKTEYVIEQRDGKTDVKRAGLGAEQGKNIEYEFDLLMMMEDNHYATILKDRTGKFQDQIIKMPDEAFGKSIADWLKEGSAPIKTTNPARDAVKKAADKQEGDDAILAIVAEITEIVKASPENKEAWKTLKEESGVKATKPSEFIPFGLEAVTNLRDELKKRTTKEA